MVEHFTWDLPPTNVCVQYSIVKYRHSVSQQISRTYLFCIMEYFCPQAVVALAISTSSQKRVLALSQDNLDCSCLGPVLCPYVLAQEHFPDRKGLRYLDLTAWHTVGSVGLGILGEKNTAYVYIDTSLAGREKILSPVKVTAISGNLSDLVTKAMGPEARENSLSGTFFTQSWRWPLGDNRKCWVK